MAGFYGSVLLVSALVLGRVWSQGNIFQPINPQQLERMLGDRRFVQQQLSCVLGRAACDQTGNQLKVAIPEVLVRDCRLCTPYQAENARKVVDHIQYNYPEEWAQIQAKYKPRRN